MTSHDVRLSVVLSLLCCAAVGSPGSLTSRVFWGWWRPTTTRYPATTTVRHPASQADELHDQSANLIADLGSATTAGGVGTTAFGESTTTFGESTITFGESTTTFGESTITFGESTTAFGESTTAFGESTTTEPSTTTWFSTSPPAGETPTSTEQPTSTYSEQLTSTQWSESATVESTRPKYRVYWNVPSFQCHKYGLNFSRVAAWGLEQNPSDEFRGEAVAILYDPGEFPALLQASRGGVEPRNGGVPQEADLDRHLTLFAMHMDKLVPDLQFSGLGIIDFEHWRPVWRQNWGSLAVYRDYSRQIERLRHPYWFSSIIEGEASYKYELAARSFMLETLRMAKRLRPRAKWGYYGYPFCFNYTPNNNRASCSYETRRDNDEMSWMFDEQTAYYPSLYLKEGDMYPWKRRRFVDGRLSESMRVAKDAPVYPYVWYKYHDTRKFLTEGDMKSVLRRPRGRGCRGAVIWGASRDVNTRDKCLALEEYLERVIGPAVQEVTSESWRDREDLVVDETTTAELEEEEEVEEEEEYVENVPYVH